MPRKDYKSSALVQQNQTNQNTSSLNSSTSRSRSARGVKPNTADFAYGASPFSKEFRDAYARNWMTQRMRGYTIDELVVNDSVSSRPAPTATAKAVPLSWWVTITSKVNTAALTHTITMADITTAAGLPVDVNHFTMLRQAQFWANADSVDKQLNYVSTLYIAPDPDNGIISGRFEDISGGLDPRKFNVIFKGEGLVQANSSTSKLFEIGGSANTHYVARFLITSFV